MQWKRGGSVAQCDGPTQTFGKNLRSADALHSDHKGVGATSRLVATLGKRRATPRGPDAAALAHKVRWAGGHRRL